MLKNNQSYYVMLNESTMQFYIGKCQIKADCQEYFKKALRAINPELKAEDFIDITYDAMIYMRTKERLFDGLNLANYPYHDDVNYLIDYVTEYDDKATLLNRQRKYQSRIWFNRFLKELDTTATEEQKERFLDRILNGDKYVQD